MPDQPVPRAGGLHGSSVGCKEPSSPESCPLHPRGPQADDRLLSEILSGEAEGENSSDYAGGGWAFQLRRPCAGRVLGGCRFCDGRARGSEERPRARHRDGETERRDQKRGRGTKETAPPRKKRGRRRETAKSEDKEPETASETAQRGGRWKERGDGRHSEPEGDTRAEGAEAKRQRERPVWVCARV